jgi:hypothetical protein
VRDVRIRGKLFLQWIEKYFVLRVLTRCTWLRIGSKFNVYGSVLRKYIPIYIQQGATLHSLFVYGNCSTCFGWYHHPSSGANTTISTASGIFYTVATTYRYGERVGTHFSNSWMSWKTFSTHP